MPQASKDIQRRLKSVRNINKITRAMELVAASKMRKSVSRVLASRAYADTAWKTAMNLVQRLDATHHPLLEERPVSSIAMLVVSSNRGLCGAFNMNIVHKAVQFLASQDWPEAHFFTLGKKGAQELSRLRKHIVSDYQKNDITASAGELSACADELVSGFLAKTYDRVFLAYTDFESSLRQVQRIRYLLPLYRPSKHLGHIGPDPEGNGAANGGEYLFEPSRRKVLDALLPRIVEVQLYQAVLETEASEHSARMMAMRNATEAATDMIDSLSLAYNQARQAAITAELAEISAATVAVQ